MLRGQSWLPSRRRAWRRLKKACSRTPDRRTRRVRAQAPAPLPMRSLTRETRCQAISAAAIRSSRPSAERDWRMLRPSAVRSHNSRSGEYPCRTAATCPAVTSRTAVSPRPGWRRAAGSWRRCGWPTRPSRYTRRRPGPAKMVPVCCRSRRQARRQTCPRLPALGPYMVDACDNRTGAGLNIGCIVSDDMKRSICCLCYGNDFRALNVSSSKASLQASDSVAFVHHHRHDPGRVWRWIAGYGAYRSSDFCQSRFHDIVRRRVSKR